MSSSSEKGDFISIVERDQSGIITAEYRQQGNQNIVQVHQVVQSNSLQPQAISHIQNIINIFLPAGYPKSVTDDYLDGDLAVGFEDSNASTTAAVLLKIVQDSIGRVATILFAHRLGSSLEPECKRFRFAADIFNDSALIVDCLSPVFPKPLRVVLLSTAGTLRALCGVAGGGSKAQLSVHFSKWGNVAELNAKDSSQETVISLMGMLMRADQTLRVKAGSLVISSVTSKTATWASMLFLIAVHLWTNYRAVKAVTMVTLNRQRANSVMSTFAETGVMLTPKDVARQERIFERDGVLRWCDGAVVGWGVIGTKLSSIVARKSASGSLSLAEVAKACPTEQYMLWFGDKLRDIRVCICLENGCTPAGQFRAWMHGLLSAKLLSDRRSQAVTESDALRALVDAKRQLDGIFEEFLEKAAEAGWDTGDPQLETSSSYRYERTKLQQKDL
ncbi:hypothetical protein AOL_s00110g70 [Orbilia oligospora ATCC 24927]|uniref:DUF647 domain-containing protein n=1 Tax=Arthrobotrys oligospora (strain ATCC 24927 / CBS 115.81 / DSM 1491) TaxID=756982 RepID=G1XKQ0_ARTOA|nr:hypothetical protein AOL_s00110g70 [Orbilia oligospora ATCC 24927]EGX46246.1 hypothetical protein AOL_s00110g70 [Orbilia oligospora ATCC 24927]